MKQLIKTKPKWHIRYLKTWPYATCFRILTKLRASKIPSSCDNADVSAYLEGTPLWTVIFTGEFISESKQYEVSNISSKSNNYQHESVPLEIFIQFIILKHHRRTLLFFLGECRKALLVLCYFLSNFEVKNNKSLFCSLFEDGFCDVKLLMRELYQQCTRRLLWVKIRHAFCPPAFGLCVFLFSTLNKSNEMFTTACFHH